jgi:hypothetical protein
MLREDKFLFVSTILFDLYAANLYSFKSKAQIMLLKHKKLPFSYINFYFLVLFFILKGGRTKKTISKHLFSFIFLLTKTKIPAHFNLLIYSYNWEENISRCSNMKNLVEELRLLSTFNFLLPTSLLGSLSNLHHHSHKQWQKEVTIEMKSFHRNRKIEENE